MFHSGFRITGLIHVWHQRNIFNTQTVDHNMGMYVSAMIMSIRMRNDDRLMSRKVLSAKLNSQFLGTVNSQPVILCVTRIVTDNVVMAFHISAKMILRLPV